MSLATKYRPHSFSEVLGQDVTVKILKRQIETNTISNCYLFAGPSGTGKTTLARLLANELNKGVGEPFEIDAASNNGVDNVREIIESSNERSLSGEYKIYIIDECHMITTAGWNAFLKCLEEMPKYTIFIFCTTDPQKMPDTIMNRVMRFNLNRVDISDIKYKLEQICQLEGFDGWSDSMSYLASLSNGSVRTSIANLEKVAMYSPQSLTMENISKVLGVGDQEVMFKITNDIYDKKETDVVSTIEDMYKRGINLVTFFSDYVKFIFDLTKYIMFQSMDVTSLPKYLEDKVKYTTGVGETQKQSIDYFVSFSDKMLNIKNQLSRDVDPKTTLEIMLLSVMRGE